MFHEKFHFIVTLLVIQACSFAISISDDKDFTTRKKQEGRAEKNTKHTKSRKIKNQNETHHSFARRKDLQSLTGINKFSGHGKQELKTKAI